MQLGFWCVGLWRSASFHLSCENQSLRVSRPLCTRMPLVLAFFTTGDRVNSLFDNGLQQILQVWGVVAGSFILVWPFGMPHKSISQINPAYPAIKALTVAYQLQSTTFFWEQLYFSTEIMTAGLCRLGQWYVYEPSTRQNDLCHMFVANFWQG